MTITKEMFRISYEIFVDIFNHIGEALHHTRSWVVTIFNHIGEGITPHQVMGGGHKVISPEEWLTISLRFLATVETYPLVINFAFLNVQYLILFKRVVKLFIRSWERYIYVCLLRLTNG